jgi:hypothetical protein
MCWECFHDVASIVSTPGLPEVTAEMARQSGRKMKQLLQENLDRRIKARKAAKVRKVERSAKLAAIVGWQKEIV